LSPAAANDPSTPLQETSIPASADFEPAAATAQLDPQALNGTNDLRLAVFSNDAQGQVLLTAMFDNLGKGASGAAVQSLELMLGVSGQ